MTALFKTICLCHLAILLLPACRSAPDNQIAREQGSSKGETTVRDSAGAEENKALVSETVYPQITLSPIPTPTAVSTRSFAGTIPAPEFPTGLDWLNVARPLTLAELRGKIIILDFWTYGCVNCLHVIPELKQLEQKYADELVVIGIHSAKFTNESETDNIRQIVLRYELEHPVVNDENMEIWNEYGARAWPTLALIDPDGNVFGFHAGEEIYGAFDQAIGHMVQEFDALGRIDRTPLELLLERESLANSPLLFPGKVLADAENGRLFIADSNHNRIVVSDLNGRVLEVIGNGRRALEDGTYESASFFRPQGMALADPNTLYVADTENHALRRINLQSRLVETVAGNGTQGNFQVFEGRGTSVPLNSPWDVAVVNDLVYIAMAGQHQIWLFDPSNNVVRAFAGSALEELKDGSWQAAGFNQPSGLATDGERRLYVADSEASAIRVVVLDPEAAAVGTIVGTGLFHFGDVDGVAAKVLLQHPLGVAYDDGRLLVADTYNNKIKVVDPITRESTTLLGNGEDGWRDSVQSAGEEGSGGAEEIPLFDEPGGLSLANDMLYIADTNNHVIRTVVCSDGFSRLSSNNCEVSTLVLADPDGLLTRQPEGEPYRGKTITFESQTIAAGEGAVTLQVELPSGYKLNEIAPFSADYRTGDLIITLTPPESPNLSVSNLQSQLLISAIAPTFPLEIPATFTAGETSLQTDLVIYYCEAIAQSLCLIEQVRLLLPIIVTADVVATATTNKVELNYTIPEPPNLDNG